MGVIGELIFGLLFIAIIFALPGLLWGGAKGAANAKKLVDLKESGQDEEYDYLRREIREQAEFMGGVSDLANVVISERASKWHLERDKRREEKLVKEELVREKARIKARKIARAEAGLD